MTIFNESQWLNIFYSGFTVLFYLSKKSLSVIVQMNSAEYNFEMVLFFSAV